MSTSESLWRSCSPYHKGNKRDLAVYRRCYKVIITPRSKIKVFIAAESPPPHSLACSLTVPTLSLSPYFSRTFSLWYFQNCLDESLPAILFRILGPPGCSSRKSRRC